MYYILISTGKFLSKDAESFFEKKTSIFFVFWRKKKEWNAYSYFAFWNWEENQVWKKIYFIVAFALKIKKLIFWIINLHLFKIRKIFQNIKNCVLSEDWNRKVFERLKWKDVMLNNIMLCWQHTYFGGFVWTVQEEKVIIVVHPELAVRFIYSLICTGKWIEKEVNCERNNLRVCYRSRFHVTLL